MDNETLAGMVQAGDREALLKLWGQLQRLTWKQIHRWMGMARQGGLEPEDLLQSAFLALLGAVDTYTPEKGTAFSTWYTLHLRREFTAAAGARTTKQAADPLRNAASLDAPVLSEDGEEGEHLLDLLEDHSAAEAFQETDMRLTVRAVLSSLPPEQQAALYRWYWLGLTTDKKAHAAALRYLRHPSRSRELRNLL